MKGICPVCGKEVELEWDGPKVYLIIGAHKDTEGVDCDGYGEDPEEVLSEGK